MDYDGFQIYGFTITFEASNSNLCKVIKKKPVIRKEHSKCIPFLFKKPNSTSFFLYLCQRNF